MATEHFSIDDSDIEHFERQLQTFAKKALPFATRQTLNSAAFAAQKTGRENVRNQMVTRNRFSVQSIQVDKARGLNIRSQEAITGSIADYMRVQEFGGIKAKEGKEGVSIPTSASAGQPENSQPRYKLPRADNKLASIQLKKNRKRKPKNKKQETLFKIQDAVITGDRYIFLELGRRKGIFRVVGGSARGMKRGGPKGAKLRMMHDLTNETVVVPRNPWLQPAQMSAIKKIPEFYEKALTFQIKKHNLFQD